MTEHDTTATELQAAYWDMIHRLHKVEASTGVTLIGIGDDDQNALDGGTEYGTAEYWALRLTSAQMHAGYRAEAAGLDLNSRFRRPIY